MTLDRLLSRFGLASRTAARESIRAGRIRVNNRIIRDLDFRVRPERDVILLNGRPVKPQPKSYLMFHKPKDVITSHGDPEGRKTVYDYLGEAGRWLVAVGRLDKDTSGLLLMTNDTDFANFVTDPESEISKTYLVKLNRPVPDEVIAKLNAGVRMKRGDWAKPRSVCRAEDRGRAWLEVVLTEGKNREVRRMTEAVGFKVEKLVRTAIGPIRLEGLEEGKWRALTSDEVTEFRNCSARPVRRGG